MKLFMHTACSLILLALTTLSARAELPVVLPVEGTPFRAALAAVDDKWQLEFDAEGKSRPLPAAELVSWGAPVEAADGPIVVTADGGLLVADVYRADSETLMADSALFGALKLPLESLSGVVFDPPNDRARRDAILDRVARATGRADRLVLHNGDEVTGLFEAVQNDTVRLDTDAGPIEIETDRIDALIFDPSLKQQSEADGLRAWVGLADGSRLLAGRMRLDEASLQITTSFGQTWKTSPGELVFLQPLGGRATYLSDLKPAGYRHVPYLSLPWPYRADRNVAGGWLRGGGRPYLKGLGVHSAARLTYALDGSHQRFQAALAVDDSTAGGGSVRFRVLLDGHPKFTSETIRGGMAPVPISVELGGAKRLDLIVDFADRADQLDRANWLDARLVE